MHTTDWLAKASLSSIRSRSPTLIPARARTLRTAGIGPAPMIAGSMPATAVATTRAIGFRPRAFARSASTSRTADAPSLIPELLPAVTLPPSRKAGRSLASASSDESARGCSSRVTRIGSPFFCATGTGTSWPSKAPRSIAATAFCWLASANASCRSRLTTQRSTTFSAVSPIEYRLYFAASFGLMNRQPSVVSWSSRLPRSQAASAFAMTYGARVIDSTPPPMKTSPSSTAMAWAAELIAWSPDPQRRFTVSPPTSTGRPASRSAIRATSRLSSPA